ncbi:MAG: ATP-binding protein, partial [Planctomycetota bacterium]|nr:ATP-binding protein [Planctomycetota bacterium]
SMLRQAPDPLHTALEHLRVIYRLIALTGPSFKKHELLERVMDLIFEEFDPDRGLVLLGDQPHEELDPIIMRYGSSHRHREEQNIGVGRIVLTEAMNSGHGVLATKFLTDQRFNSGGSGTITKYAVLCVPIRCGDRMFGAIHIESSRTDRAFNESQLQLLNVFGQHTGLALLNAELLTSKVQNERLATVGETVASLSHSIKNILQGLRGGADAVELALGRGDLDMAKEGWPILNRNLDRIFALTLNMLAFSKPQTLEIEQIQLNTLIREAAELIRSHCQRKKSKLHFELDENLPPMHADPNAIHQAMMNLLFNAVEAIPAKRGVVTVRTLYKPETQVVEISVIDNGPGIDPALRKDIFEPFASTKGQRGTGLGLAVTKKLINDHGGELTLETRLGEGSTFTIILPEQTDHTDPDDTKHPTPLPGVEIQEEL